MKLDLIIISAAALLTTPTEYIPVAEFECGTGRFHRIVPPCCCSVHKHSVLYDVKETLLCTNMENWKIFDYVSVHFDAIVNALHEQEQKQNKLRKMRRFSKSQKNCAWLDAPFVVCLMLQRVCLS
ncbi:hypothetical protein QR680_004002 [Steinernema hermaphroditum]|uniref:Methyltransferase domain-containing protein n=1 Tax=Steinernema hermaphroditum TaxID=289476 RepID=A0AA39LSZ1_9BILA|nr:hypothetical protein QR680_004002 [Steinernema hermaphroditum]